MNRQKSHTTHWKRPWWWERWKAKEEECRRVWDGWIISPICACKSLQSCSTLCHLMDSSPRGFSVYGILQARILEWDAMPPPRDLPDLRIEPNSPTQWTWIWANSGRVKDKETWHSAVCGYAKSQTWLSDCKTTTWPNLTGIGNNPLKLCGPIVLELREGRTELIVCRAKPVALFISKVGVQYHLNREQPMASPNCRAKLVASAENSGHTQPESGPENSELYNPWVLVCCPARGGKLIHSPTYYTI